MQNSRNYSPSKPTPIDSSYTSLSARTARSLRRTSLSIAGAFTCIGLATAAYAMTASPSNYEAVPPPPLPTTLSHSDLNGTSPASSASDNPGNSGDTSDNNAAAYTRHSTVTSLTNENGTISAQVKVDGQVIPLPENGNVTKTITDDSGQTNVNVSTNNQTSANNSSSSSLNVNVSTQTYSSDTSTSSSDSSP